MTPPAHRHIRQPARTCLLLCAFGLASAAGCVGHLASSKIALLSVPPNGGRVALDSSVIRTSHAEFDSVTVVGIARNTSEDTLRICFLFDFDGGFHRSQACAGLERPPVFHLIGKASFESNPLECRSVVLQPGASFADSVESSLYRPDFDRCPGKITLRGTLWVGQPGQVFREASRLSPTAIELVIDVP